VEVIKTMKAVVSDVMTADDIIKLAMHSNPAKQVTL
jgi:hypothetical protein